MLVLDMVLVLVDVDELRRMIVETIVIESEEVIVSTNDNVAVSRTVISEVMVRVVALLDVVVKVSDATKDAVLSMVRVVVWSTEEYDKKDEQN